MERFFQRAEHRDPDLQKELYQLFQEDLKTDNLGQIINEPWVLNNATEKATQKFRDYMLEESTQQYKDYYESDQEEHSFFEFMENLPNRDRIRFMEIFEDHTVVEVDKKAYLKIPKREFNPELSMLSNFALDVVDFKDRVKPSAKDAALLD